MREDPVRPGLLFAGTERAIWVSFNDGDSWQSLQLNLPATSMRDLVVHGDDIVVGTHGRSFWILDDITPLRQMAESQEKENKGGFILKPATAYRVRRDINPDTPLPPEEPAGKNPPDGAIIDYYLESPLVDQVNLHILDANQKLVRSYSSKDKPEVTEEQLKKELNVPLYWVRPPETLSAAPGMHRFLWDMRTAPPKSVFHEYPISAIPHDTPRYPLGASVPPGTYYVQLIAGSLKGGRQSSVPVGQIPVLQMDPLEVKMDPRVKATPADLAAQFELASKICDEMNASYAGLEQVRSVRAQLKSLAGKSPKGPLADAVSALEQKASALEGAAQRFGPPAKADSFAKLNGQLAQLLGVVESADAAPTDTARTTFADVERSLAGVQKNWDDVKAHDIPALNERLRAAKLPGINPSAAVGPAAEPGDEDEP